MRRLVIPVLSGIVAAAFSYALAQSSRVGGHPPDLVTVIVATAGSAVLGALVVMPAAIERAARRATAFWNLPGVIWPVIALAAAITVALLWDFAVLLSLT